MNYGCRTAAIFCAAAALASPSRATGLSAQVNTFFDNNGVITCLQSSGGYFGTFNAPLVGCLDTFGQSSFQSQGSASAAWGSLRVFGSVSATNLNVPAGSIGLNWLDRVDADMADTLTISSGSFLNLTVAFTGTESHAGAMFFLDGGVVPYAFPGLNTFPIPFRPGVPFALDLGLRVDLPGSLTPDQPQGQSFAQYVDGLGNPVTGATITSDSGFDYTNPLGSPSATPEPGSLSLAVAGMALVLAPGVVTRWSRRGQR